MPYLAFRAVKRPCLKPIEVLVGILTKLFNALKSNHMITIEKIKIEFAKWWQTGIIIIAIILITIIAVKAEPDTLIKLLGKIWKKLG